MQVPRTTKGGAITLVACVVLGNLDPGCAETVSESSVENGVETTVGTVGEVFFTTPGAVTWVVPNGVNVVSVVVVGAGGSSWEDGSGGGGGGGLCYLNDIPVTPGTSIPIVVGAPPIYFGFRVNSGSSFDAVLLASNGQSPVDATDFVGDDLGGTGGGGYGGHCFTGGNGGSAASADDDSMNNAGGGGGGAGYAGNGGNGGSDVGESGSGGSGGGGGGNLLSMGGPMGAGGGGGVGVYGLGTSGIGGSVLGGGGGGSGGQAGTAQNVGPNQNSNGGAFGGGGGSNVIGAGVGGGGAVRIIWGSGRSFPTNAAPVN